MENTSGREEKKRREKERSGKDLEAINIKCDLIEEQ